MDEQFDKQNRWPSIGLNTNFTKIAFTHSLKSRQEYPSGLLAAHNLAGMVLALLKRGKLLRGPRLQVFYHGNDRQDTAGTKASQISVSGKGVNIHTYVQTTTHTHEHKNKTTSKAEAAALLGCVRSDSRFKTAMEKKQKCSKGQHTHKFTHTGLTMMRNKIRNVPGPVLSLSQTKEQWQVTNFTQKNGDAHSKSHGGCQTV